MANLFAPRRIPFISHRRVKSFDSVSIRPPNETIRGRDFRGVSPRAHATVKVTGSGTLRRNEGRDGRHDPDTQRRNSRR
jgi:hypothetical protein